MYFCNFLQFNFNPMFALGSCIGNMFANSLFGNSWFRGNSLFTNPFNCGIQSFMPCMNNQSIFGFNYGMDYQMPQIDMSNSSIFNNSWFNFNSMSLNNTLYVTPNNFSAVSPSAQPTPSRSQTHSVGSRVDNSNYISNERVLATRKPEGQRPAHIRNLQDLKDKHGLNEGTLSNGLTVKYVNGVSFRGCQQEWMDELKHMYEVAEQEGYTIVIGDFSRTASASDASRAQHGDIVARGGESPHNYGVAVDISLYDRDGNIIGYKSDEFRNFANKVKTASDNKIEWGGDWSADNRRRNNDPTSWTKENEHHHFQLAGWRNSYKRDEYLLR